MTRKNKVQVWLRTKPSQNFTSEYLSIQNDLKTAVIHIPKEEKVGIVNNQVSNWSFSFDGIYHNSSQEDVFQGAGESIIDGLLNGYNCSVLCYGQTGAGKTFTMTGATEKFSNRGLVPRFLSRLYRQLAEDSDNSVTIKISYLEIYNEQLFDLLNTLNMEGETSNLGITEDEDGVISVKGLGCYLAQSEEDALNLLFEGEANRATAAHILNKRSSRSHCIFTVYFETRSRLQSQANYSVSKIQFVDLAGSERLQKTNSVGKIQQEASYINKSLSFLEQTVIALSDRNREHIPYRQSKLTHFLKDSLGGRSKTMLIANVWSDADQLEETISTMRFAQRMMRVASEPVENVKYDPTILIKNLQKENASLRHELSMYDALHNRNHAIYEPLSEQYKFEIREQARRFIDGELADLDIVNLRQVQGMYDAFKHIYKNQKLEYDEKLRSLTESMAATAATSAQPGTSASPQQPAKGVSGGTAAGGKRTGQNQTSLGETPQSSSLAQVSKVGDLDRSNGFGVGQADKSQLDDNGGYLQSRKKDRKKNLSSLNSKRDTTGGKEEGSVADQEALSEKTNEVPSRSDAFEEFKKENGQGIYKILTENKEFLSNKKKEYSNLANEINAVKVEIDTTKINLETLKRERECQGPSYTSEGEIIITEEEYQEIERLNLSKRSYREKYEQLKNIKSEISYCQKMVDSTRHQLLKDFDVWYTDAYLDGEQASKEIERELIKKINYEDPIEKFDSVKHAKYEDNPEEEAYNRAKEALYHRHIFGAALNQPQPVRRKPGTPVLVNPRNDTLPNQMEIIQP